MVMDYSLNRSRNRRLLKGLLWPEYHFKVFYGHKTFHGKKPFFKIIYGTNTLQRTYVARRPSTGLLSLEDLL